MRRNAPDFPDALWHLTDRVNAQAWHLAPEYALALFLEAFDAATRAFDVDVLAWVAMSNHIHAVVRSPSAERYSQLTSRRCRNRHYRPYPAHSPKSSVIGQCARKMKLRVCTRIHEHLGVTGHFWQGRHHRQLITDARSLVTRIAYDHRNPVRKGMSVRAEHYPRSSARWWTDGTPGPIELVRRPDLPFDLDLERLREAVVHYQESKIVDDIMESFATRRRRIETPEGQALFLALLDEAGVSLPRAP